MIHSDEIKLYKQNQQQVASDRNLLPQFPLLCQAVTGARVRGATGEARRQLSDLLPNLRPVPGEAR